MLDEGIGAREDLGLAAIFPADEVGRCTILTKHLQYLSISLRLTLMVPAHNQPIAWVGP
jgi:hypothetical protein